MRIAFISPCGFGNLGDAAIQDAFLGNVRQRLGERVEFIGITQNPGDTGVRHRVRAVPMDAEGFRIRSRHSNACQDDARESKDVPAIASATRPAKRIIKELLHWRLAIREMRHADVLAVSGGGQLDDHWGGPWRVPYALWKWSLAATLFRKSVVFFSVGAGTTDSRLSRFFLRSALGRARYASFRDGRTAERVRKHHLSASRIVVPDLAFSHEGRTVERPAKGTGPRPMVVLSPIAFLDPRSWPAKDAQTYASSVDRTAKLARRLIERGLDVVLCTSDSPDIKTAEEVFQAASIADCRASLPGTLEFADTRDLAELLNWFRKADVAIASRLHGLILANLVGTPTIALSYDWKVDEHMRVMGLERYTFSVGSFDPEDVARTVDSVLASREALSTAISAKCEHLAAEVLHQYEEALEMLAPDRE